MFVPKVYILTAITNKVMSNQKFTYIAAWVGVIVALGINVGAEFNKIIATAAPIGRLILFFVTIYLLTKIDWKK